MLDRAKTEKYQQVKNQENNSGLIADRKRITSRNHTQATKKNDSHTCLKTLKKIFL
jgi:hypothetical protein